MKKHRVILLLFLIFPVLCLSGCWDYREFENLTLVSVMGFDTDPAGSQVTVTIGYLVPGGSSSQQQDSSKKTAGMTIIKATGYSIDQALEKSQQICGKRLFYGYMQEIILGENAAKTIAKDIIGFVDRSPNTRTSAYIAVTSDTAEYVLQTTDSGVSEVMGKRIHNLIDQARNSGSAYPVSIQDFEEKISVIGRNPVAPRVTAVRSASSGGSSSATASSGASSGSSGETSGGSASSKSGASSSDSDPTDAGATVLKQKEGYFKIDGIAVFHKDVLQGFLSDQESTGLGWVTNQKQYPYEIMKTTKEPDVSNTIAFRITKSSCKTKVKVENGKPVADIDAYVEADLRKIAKNTKEDALTPEAVGKLEKKLAESVRSEINVAVQKGQSLKSDVFDVGFHFYRQNAGLWHSEYEKKWDQIFPAMKVNINVTAKVIDTGTTVKKLG